MAIVALLSVAVLFFRRAHHHSSSRASETPRTGHPSTSSIPPPPPPRRRRGSLNPIDAWRHLIAARPPSTGTYVYSPASPVIEETGSTPSSESRHFGPPSMRGSFAGLYGASAHAGRTGSAYGPSAGIPEVQDIGTPGSYGAQSFRSPQAPVTSIPHSAYDSRAPELLEEERPRSAGLYGPRPPTRLTTPGMGSSYGGSAGDLEQGRREPVLTDNGHYASRQA